MPDQRQFREVIGHFTTGVTVVTSLRADGRPCGMTANSVASVSLDPLLILVCLDREAASHGCVIDGGAFAVSILSHDDEALARRFAEGEREDRFTALEWRAEVTGSPVLSRALAWVDCRVRDVHEGGDHSIVVGEVMACDAREGEPLVFYRGEYRRMPG
ncbi:MAG: flavin reductase family protein [Gemmatimonadetes bacterium]|nr:flavin reductase family protein [Gemmatimonadota bacterium]